MREVRQRCGFGCIICGCPIYEYDHILGWANVKRHKVDEITLLCDSHHRAKTAGFLPNDLVIEANRTPYNLRQGLTTPYGLYYYGEEFRIDLGSVLIGGDQRGHPKVCEAIRIDDQPLFWITNEDNHLLLSLRIHDSQGRLVLEISDNELVLNTNSWDIEVVGTRITIREAARNVLFDIRFRPPGTVIVSRGRFLYNGVEFLVTPKWCAILNIAYFLMNVRLLNYYADIVIGDSPNSPPTLLRFVNVPRKGWDRAAAIRIIRESVAQARASEAVFNQLLESKSLE
jgi:trigger factor